MDGMEMSKTWLTIMIAALLVGLMGCSAPTPTPIRTPTLLPSATPRPLPSPTPVPAASPPPTPTPTPTPAPTDTPLPTPTAPPPPTPSAPPTEMPTLTPADTPTPAVVVTPIGQINASNIGQQVTVEGRVVEAASFSAGFKFTLDDGTGRIVLLMWHNVYDNCWDAAEINLGALVQAAGQVGQYEGELQIEPDFGGDVKALEGATAHAAARQIGSLSGADDGQRVMIEGQVVRVEGLSQLVKVFVDDGTGEIVVLLWRNVLDRVSSNTALGTPGSRVRIVGQVSLYKGNLQVTPTLPNDVIVLSGG